VTTENSLETLNQETRDIWNQNAPFWDAQMGDGNQFQRVLVGPASERLLNLKKDESVLEIACGNGVFTRRMAQLGAYVVASDFSEQLIELAKGRSTSYADRIEYHVIDATNEEQLLTLGERRFNAAVCNMALMDMATIEPLLSALSKLLKIGGRFVFSILHPCFNSGSTMMLEANDQTGEYVETYSVKVSQYLTPSNQKGLAIIGQPQSQNYFFRPLHILFNACFQAGFVMDGLEEPGFGPSDAGTRLVSWANFKEIPPVLVARFVLLS